MAELLTTKEMVAALDGILKRAEKFIYIFTFNIKIDPNFMSRLRNASKRDVKIIIVFGVENRDNQVLWELAEIPTCTIYFNDKLHAKFYYNEKELLIGSMNLSEASAKNNFELGALFKGSEYYTAIEKVKEEANEIITDAQPWNQNRRYDDPYDLNGDVWSTQDSHSSLQGHCIRCGVGIRMDPGRPLCSDCYYEWAEWEDEFYPERFCHRCGQRKNSISFAKPECRSCWRS